jgi:hypothetical protein
VTGWQRIACRGRDGGHRRVLKGVWHILKDDFELLLVNARHVKQVPGPKTDMSDTAWLCQVGEAGLLKGSFVSPSRCGRCAC